MKTFMLMRWTKPIEEFNKDDYIGLSTFSMDGIEDGVITNARMGKEEIILEIDYDIDKIINLKNLN